MKDGIAVNSVPKGFFNRTNKKELAKLQNEASLSNFEKLRIKSPNTPKHGTLILLLSWVKNLAKLLSTIVYKIIEFLFFLQTSNIF